MAGRRHRLGEPGRDIGLVEEHLTGEIRKLGHVAIDDPDLADAGADQRQRHNPAERSATDQRHVRRGQPFLAAGADRREPNLTRVAIGVERHGVICGSVASRRPFR